jgi:hypothetical protein
MSPRTVSAIAFIVGLVAYVACGRIARRSPHHGGGTVVLSWIGLFVPCIAWIALFQGYTALNRTIAASPSAEAVKNKRAFVQWAIGYVVALIVAGILGAPR